MKLPVIKFYAGLEKLQWVQKAILDATKETKEFDAVRTGSKKASQTT